MPSASGAFEVKLTPQPAGQETGIARLSIEKRFFGDLEGDSRGEMLAVHTGIADSAGYVALERVTGSLAGRRGSFVLQHSGIMARGAPQLTVTVVPDSGTDELAGLAGEMSIVIANGEHRYVLEYTL